MSDGGAFNLAEAAQSFASEIEELLRGAVGHPADLPQAMQVSS